MSLSLIRRLLLSLLILLFAGAITYVAALPEVAADEAPAIISER